MMRTPYAIQPPAFLFYQLDHVFGCQRFTPSLIILYALTIRTATAWEKTLHGGYKKKTAKDGGFNTYLSPTKQGEQYIQYSLSAKRPTAKRKIKYFWYLFWYFENTGTRMAFKRRRCQRKF